MNPIKFILYLLGCTILVLTLSGGLFGLAFIVGKYFGIYGVVIGAVIISALTVHSLKTEFFD